MAMEEYSGWLHIYSEQGMEGGFVWALQDERFAMCRGGGWSQAGTVFLENGDELTVYEDNGKVLWSGKIQTVAAPAEIGSNWVPAEVDFATWRSYFDRRPRARAVLRRVASPRKPVDHAGSVDEESGLLIHIACVNTYP